MEATQIPTNTSAAKPRTITVDGIDHAVRYVPGAGAAPSSTGTWKVAEVDGIGSCWVRCNGKAYADPSLPSNFDVVDPAGRWLGMEGANRDDIIARWIRRQAR